MNKPGFIIALSLFALLFSCKSKKDIVTASPKADTASDVQYDAYRNRLPGTKVEHLNKTIKVTFDSKVLFPTNSSYLTDEAKEKIKALVDVIKEGGPVKILIEGHTDKTGTPEYNLWLSDRRALAVKTYAVDLGLPEASITTKGYGDTHPVADNRTPEGRGKNRRVELTITPAAK